MTSAFTIMSVETRRFLAYRADFWGQTIGSVVTHVVITSMLWSAVFAESGQTSVGGYSLPGMILYALIAALVFQCVQGEPFGMLSTEIYDGSLTRYLIYPVSLLTYKFLGHVARFVLTFGQLLLGLLGYVLLWGWPADTPCDVRQFGIGAVAIFLASCLHFWIACSLELLAFWADNVWGFQAMLRMAVQLLGGIWLPLTIFPIVARQWLHWSPFPAMAAVPIETILGHLQGFALLHGILLQCAWIATFWLLAHTIFARGLRAFSGVGM